jgi:hypothetical protein
MSRTQNCQIPGCDTVIRTRFLLCHQHWQMLPRSLQDRVNDEYRRWMEQGGGDPTVGYRKVVEEAIKRVTEKSP